MVNTELERIRMEAVMAYFKVLSQHLPRMNAEILNQNIQAHGWESNLWHPAYKTRVLITQPQNPQNDFLTLFIYRSLNVAFSSWNYMVSNNKISKIRIWKNVA